MYSLCHRLCHGGTRETGTTISNRIKVGIADFPTLRPGILAHCRIARDERFERLTCSHKGTYADDCLVSRVMQHRCYIVGTNDQALRRRIRKIPGVPIMFVGRGKYKVEKLPTELA